MSRRDDIHAWARRAGLPLLDAIARPPAGAPAGAGRRHTLLAVCPNSEAVTRAALLAAREADAPLLYAATLNQVDLDGGYTGWTPEALATFVEAEAARLAWDGPVVLCLDHGGPWKKDLHAIEERSYDETMAAVKRSVEACVRAGYGLLHLDPTVDRRLAPGTPVPVDDIVDRTVELLEHAEGVRRDAGCAPVAYEVGTEEVSGALDRVDRFSAFVERLFRALGERGLPAPTFIVGSVGTELDTPHFDVGAARRLVARAEAVGALVKGHYTDGVDNPEAYPLAGMGGANVGPGFAADEYAALMDLVALERRIGEDSGLPAALRRAVVESGRWRKWLRPGEADLGFEELEASRQAWLVETGSRYVWTDPAVVEARAKLYARVRPYRDADAFVLWRIKRAMLRYFHAFNLVGFNRRLLEALARTPPPDAGSRAALANL